MVILLFTYCNYIQSNLTAKLLDSHMQILLGTKILKNITHWFISLSCLKNSFKSFHALLEQLINRMLFFLIKWNTQFTPYWKYYSKNYTYNKIYYYKKSDEIWGYKWYSKSCFLHVILHTFLQNISEQLKNNYIKNF